MLAKESKNWTEKWKKKQKENRKTIPYKKAQKSENQKVKIPMPILIENDSYVCGSPTAAFYGQRSFTCCANILISRQMRCSYRCNVCLNGKGKGEADS
jgi:hypothetical protein